MRRWSEAPQRSWPSFYSGRGGQDYQQYVQQRYTPFIAAVRARIAGSDNVLELGCGTSTITKALSGAGALGVNLYATDNNAEMIKLAKARLKGTAAVVFLRDAFEAFSHADVVHSHGLLEHFADEQILQIVRADSGCAQIHYVPGLYASPSFGDERLLPKAYWQELLGASWSVETFNEELDYILVKERSDG